jgi:hypothetical protein
MTLTPDHNSFHRVVRPRRAARQRGNCSPSRASSASASSAAPRPRRGSGPSLASGSRRPGKPAVGPASSGLR